MMPLVCGAVGLLLVGMVGLPVAVTSTSRVDVPIGPLRAVAIPERQSVLAVESGSFAAGNEQTWTFDVRARRWQRGVVGPPSVAGPVLLAHVPGRDDVLAFPRSPGAVWSLDLDGRGWQPRTVPRTRPVDVSDIVVDSQRGVVVAWSDTDDTVWIYDPVANLWTEVARTEPWPTAQLPEGQRGYTLTAYDSDADRVVLAVLPVPGRPGSTWVLDPASGRWARQASRPPPLMYGYGEWGTEAVYDPAHGRVVLVARGAVATYDSRRDRWRTADDEAWPMSSYGPKETLSGFEGGNPWPHGIPLGVLARDGHQIVFDDVHGRIVLLGGTALFRTIGADDQWDMEWRPVREVWAYDVGFNSWTRLTGGQG